MTATEEQEGIAAGLCVGPYEVWVDGWLQSEGYVHAADAAQLAELLPDPERYAAQVLCARTNEVAYQPKRLREDD